MTGTVFIDLRKAFDSVNHSLLLKKLYALGIVDQEHEWFTGYLKGRTQVVGFQGAFSDAESICVDVPQGSILRSLLFVLLAWKRCTQSCPQEGANGSTQFSVNDYFFGQMSVNDYFFWSILS